MTEQSQETIENHLTSSSETRDRLLDAAERLFAEHGVPRSSLRAITAEAAANLAAVHYHFGSKEGLVRAVLSRRLQPLTEHRIELLERHLAECGARPDVRSIVYAFVAPVFTMIQRERGGHEMARFVGRALWDTREGMQELIVEQFEATVSLFTDALARALPQLPRAEIFWRFHFMVGAMVHTAGHGLLLHHLSRGLCDSLDADAVTERLVVFLSAGMEAET